MLSIGYQWISGFSLGAEILFATKYRPTVYIFQFGILRVELAWLNKYYQDLYEQLDKQIRGKFADE